MAENRTLHVLIHGRVQGVGFRAWTQHQGQLHGLKGWVRNRSDGAVEAVFSGPDHLVEVMLKACHHGPAGSVVERVEVVKDEGVEIDGSDGFEIRRTA